MTRRRSLPIFVLTTLAAAVTLAPADAGPRINGANAFGIGAGVYLGPDPSGTGYGGRIGLFPTYYPGFYGNGASAYGPPVPTYAPVPGVFGGSDHRINQLAPVFGFGTGWFSKRSPSPRPVPNFDYIAPGHALPEPALLPIPEGSWGQSPCFRMEVRVPASARVFVENQATSQTGMVRNFESPPLQAEEVYTYHVRAEWNEGGQVRSETRTITGRPGKPHVIDFGRGPTE